MKPVLVSLAIMALAEIPGMASTVFDTYGPGNTYTDNQSYPVGGFRTVVTVGFQFTPSATGQLSEIDVAFGYVVGSKQVTISLDTDAGNSPGSPIESYTFTDDVLYYDNRPNNYIEGTVYALYSTLHPVLTSGTNYWLVASGPQNSDNGWYLNSLGITGNSYVSSGYGTPLTSRTLGTFRVTEADVSTPEPTAFGLTGLGGLMLAGLGRKIRR